MGRALRAVEEGVRQGGEYSGDVADQLAVVWVALANIEEKMRGESSPTPGDHEHQGSG